MDRRRRDGLPVDSELLFEGPIDERELAALVGGVHRIREDLHDRFVLGERGAASRAARVEHHPGRLPIVPVRVDACVCRESGAIAIEQRHFARRLDGVVVHPSAGADRRCGVVDEPGCLAAYQLAPGDAHQLGKRRVDLLERSRRVDDREWTLDGRHGGLVPPQSLFARDPLGDL